MDIFEGRSPAEAENQDNLTSQPVCGELTSQWIFTPDNPERV